MRTRQLKGWFFLGKRRKNEKTTCGTWESVGKGKTAGNHCTAQLKRDKKMKKLIDGFMKRLEKEMGRKFSPSRTAFRKI